MSNIIEKQKRIQLMAKGVKPLDTRSDNEKTYSTEHDKYFAIKKEILSCKNEDERNNLAILFKCKNEAYKRMSIVKDFTIFGITLLNLMFSSIALVFNSRSTSETARSIASGNQFIISVGVLVTLLLFLVLFSQRLSITKQEELMYILEIFKTCNKDESQ